MPVWVLTRERGPSWDHARGLREQEAWDEHAVFMEALADEGFILLGGPVGEERVMHVIAADSEQEVYRRLAADPWEPMGLLRNVSVERWHVLLGKTALDDLERRRPNP
jgi:uncharacterized protein YciI